MDSHGNRHGRVEGCCKDLFRAGFTEAEVLTVMAECVAMEWALGKRDGAARATAFLWERNVLPAKRKVAAEVAEVDEMFETLEPLPDAEGKPADADKPAWIGPDAAAVGAALVDHPPPRPPMLVDRYLPLDVSAMVAPGGVGKTTLVLQEAIRIILGLPLYGLPIEQTGPVLIVTAEDDRDTFKHRIHRLLKAVDLTDAQRREAAGKILVEDVAAKPVRFVQAAQNGNLAFTRHLTELGDAYAGAGLALIVIDPLVSFGPGERFVNDGEQMLIAAARWLQRRTGAAVRLVHHVSKQVGRDGIIDAHAGRGGAALGDGARGMAQLVRHTADAKGYPLPNGVTAEQVEAGDVLRLHLTKLSHARRAFDYVWLLREGWRFTALDAVTMDQRKQRKIEQADAQREADVAAVVGHVRSESDAGEFPSKTCIVESGVVSEKRTRAAINCAMDRGLLEEVSLPEDVHRNGTKRYIRPAALPSLEGGSTEGDLV